MISFSSVGAGLPHAAYAQEHEPAHASATDAHAETVHEEVAGTTSTSKSREALMTTVLTNIANMKHEALKAIANNLRA